MLLLCPGVFAAETFDRLRGDRVGWARLKTPSENWMRHSRGDPVLMNYLRENTSLNIDATWYVADVEKLEEMRTYPLLFAQGVHMVQSSTGRTNIAEYMRRGGFLLIDACCNPQINLMNHDEFFRRELSFIAEVLPEARVVTLPKEHPVYRCFFQIPGSHPPHTYFQNVRDAQKERYGLYGIQIGGRLAGLISMSGLQCGWDNMVAPAGHDVACMKMLVNIYMLSMTQGGDPANPPATNAPAATAPARAVRSKPFELLSTPPSP